jgi:hypothetical protein
LVELLSIVAEDELRLLVPEPLRPLFTADEELLLLEPARKEDDRPLFALVLLLLDTRLLPTALLELLRPPVYDRPLL